MLCSIGWWSKWRYGLSRKWTWKVPSWKDNSSSWEHSYCCSSRPFYWYIHSHHNLLMYNDIICNSSSRRFLWVPSSSTYVCRQRIPHEKHSLAFSWSSPRSSHDCQWYILFSFQNNRLGFQMKPTKGNHIIGQSYVEYEGIIPPNEREETIKKLQVFESLSHVIHSQHAMSWLKRIFLQSSNTGIPKMFLMILVIFYQVFLHSSFPNSIDEKARVVHVGGKVDYPCSGTHVLSTKEIGSLLIEKIKVYSSSSSYIHRWRRELLISLTRFKIFNC